MQKPCTLQCYSTSLVIKMKQILRWPWKPNIHSFMLLASYVRWTLELLCTDFGQNFMFIFLFKRLSQSYQTTSSLLQSQQSLESTSTSPFSFCVSLKSQPPMTMMGAGPSDVPSLGSTQWAAVKTHCGCTRTAPQPWMLDVVRSDTIYGYRPQGALLPPYKEHDSLGRITW